MRPRPPAPAKTTRPSGAGALPRRRLFRLLDRRCRLLWVGAPPGAGKTTLVASYLSARRLPALWYQVEESDDDVATFFYHMALAARRAAPRTRRPLPLMKPEYWPTLSAFARRYFRDLYGRLPPSFLVVLDNCQEVPDSSRLHDVIRDGVDELPRGGRIVVISRAGPPPGLARLRAAGAMEMLGWEDLRLTPEESRSLVRLRRQRLSGDDLRRLHDKAGGWAAGLTLMLEHPPHAGRSPPAPDARTPSVVFDYFATETFGKADPATRDFLLQTAFLPWMTARMATELSGLGAAERVLSGLHTSNYFTEKRGQAEAVYQYHALFREFLQARARDTMAPERLADVQRRAARLLIDAGQVEDAVGLLRAASDWDGLGELIAAQAPALIGQGRGRTLEEWTGALPAPLVAERPWIQYWLGMARLPFGPAQARPALERAFRRFRRRSDMAGAFSAWSAVVDSIVFEWGDFTRLDPWIAELDQLAREHPGFPSPEVETRVATSMFAALMFRQPQHPAIEAWAERALALSRHADVDRRMLTGSVLSNYYLWMGQQAKAAVALDLMRDLARTRDASPLTVISYHSAEATYHWHLASPELCLRAAAAGQEAARASGIHLLDVNLAAQGAYGALIGGDLATLRERVQQIAAVAAGGHALHAAHYHFLAAWEALLRRDLPVALERAQEALRLSLESGSPFPQAWNHIGLAHILSEGGTRGAALEHLDKARELARSLRSHMLDYMLHLTEAHLGGGTEVETLAALRRGMTLGRRQGLLMMRWWRPDIMAALCARALEARIEVNYVRALVQKHGLLPDPPPIAAEAWPWAVTLRALGAFELTKDGAAAVSPGKVQHKPLLLLKALIAFGGRDVPEERLADALWPEAAGDTASQALATTLHRLRALLGEERAVRMQEHHLSLDPHRVWLDVWAFERLLGEADHADGRGRTTEAISLTERALALYRGPFLGARDADPWALSMRERLRARFLRATAKLGRWLATTDLERAVACYERGIEIDDLAEELYQGLMTSYGRLGRPSEALKVYDRCRRALAAALNVPPSPAIEAVYRSVKRS